MKQVVEISFKTESEVNELIADLRLAKRRAKRTGGGYHACCSDGECKVVFNVSLPMRNCYEGGC